MIAELLTPDGKIKTIVVTVFSLICTFAFISPIVKVFTDGKIQEIVVSSSEKQIDINYDFVTYADNVRENLLKKQVRNVLTQEGISNSTIDIETTCDYGLVEIKKVSINLSNSVIIGNDSHINISEKITILVANALNIEKDRVFVIE